MRHTGRHNIRHNPHLASHTSHPPLGGVCVTMCRVMCLED